MSQRGASAIGSLHVEVAGDGPVGLVLLPPNPLDGNSWLYQVAHFSTWFRTLAVDLPGYGHSPRLTGPISMPQLADAVWAAVSAHGVDHAVIAGVSIGASLALHMTRQEPERSIAAIISGYGYGPAKPYAARRIEGYKQGGLGYRREHMRDGFSSGFRSTPMGSYLERSAEDRAHLVDVPSIVHLFGAHGAPDSHELFEQSCPILLVMGSEDYAFERSKALHERIKGSEHAVIEGAGHACNVEQPWHWDEIVLDFLRRRTSVLDPI